MKHSIYAPILLSLLLSACATPVTLSPQGSSAEVQAEAKKQKEMVYKKLLSDNDRVFNLSFPLLTVNAKFCEEEVKPLTGMSLWSINSVTKEYRATVKSIYNLQPRPAIQLVADHGPADNAGLKSGDLIISVNGKDIPEGAKGIQTITKAFSNAKYNASTVVVERNGKQLTTRVTPARGCAWPIIVNYQDIRINAFFDGKKAIITKGMLRFTENDNELALIIAHELGHGAMLHIRKKKQNAVVGQVGGFAVDLLFAAVGVNTNGQFTKLGGNIGAGQNSVAFEQEADYVGMYFMARAGYKTAGVADFWRRMGAESPKSVRGGGSHPASPQRFLALEATHKEITRKKKRKQTLEPNMKPKDVKPSVSAKRQTKLN